MAVFPVRSWSNSSLSWHIWMIYWQKLLQLRNCGILLAISTLHIFRSGLLQQFCTNKKSATNSCSQFVHLKPIHELSLKMVSARNFVHFSIIPTYYTPISLIFYLLLTLSALKTRSCVKVTQCSATKICCRNCICDMKWSTSAVSSPRGGSGGLSLLKQSTKPPEIEIGDTINQWSFYQIF